MPSTTQPLVKLRSFKRSTAFWAAAACLAVNGVFTATNPFAKMAPEDRPADHSRVWWKAQAYLKEKPAPDVVVLGSSLVMNPLEKLDPVYLHKDLDYVHHQHSFYMEDRLSSALGNKSTTCFNFGLPGEMISDQYMLTKALFTRPENKPKLMIVGLAVRDFIDNNVDCPASTESFDLFRTFVPIDDIVALAMPSMWNRFDYWFGQSCAIFGFRNEIQQSSINAIKTVLAPAMSPKNRFFAVNDAGFRHSIVSEGEFIAKPSDSQRYQDNRCEYKNRYRSANNSLFKIEQAFLDRLFTLAASQGIDVMVVNMPITMTNLTLMPDGAYFKYLTLLKKETTQRQIAFVDLNDFKSFDPQTDFRDTAHMNSKGGRKFVDMLVHAIKANTKLVASLTNTTQEQQVATTRSNSVF